MSYQISLTGRLAISPPLEPAQSSYLKAFSRTRRMKRDSDVTARRPDPLRIAAGIDIGPEGAFFVGAEGELGQEGMGTAFDPSGKTPAQAGIVDADQPPGGQPHVWCCWEPTDDGAGLHCPEPGSHYEFASWLSYMAEQFFRPWQRTLSGEVRYRGEAESDHGRIATGDGAVRHLYEGTPGPSGEGMAAFERGQRLFALKRFTEGLEAFHLAAQRAPQWADPLWMKGLSLGRLGQEDAGMACLDEAIGLEPSPAVKAKRRTMLQSILRQIGRAQAGLERARARRNDARFAEAVEEYAAFLAAIPEDRRSGEDALDALLGLGLSQQGQGDHEQALRTYEQAIAAFPSDPNGWNYKAYLLAYQLKRPAEALACFEQAVALGSVSSKTWNELGMLHGQSGSLDKARAAFLQATAADPSDALAWYNLGHTHLALGDARQAADCFGKAVALNEPLCLAPARRGLEQARLRLGEPPR